jgi:hypothetical protein
VVGEYDVLALHGNNADPLIVLPWRTWGGACHESTTMTKGSNRQEQKLIDDARLIGAWRKWHREEREAVLARPHGVALGELFRMFENLRSLQPAQLIGFVRSIDWASIDYATRLVVVHELNTAVTAIREKHGLEPIDDGLPGEPETPFRTICAIVLTPSPLCEGAHRGAARSE